MEKEIHLKKDNCNISMVTDTKKAPEGAFLLNAIIY